MGFPKKISASKAFSAPKQPKSVGAKKLPEPSREQIAAAQKKVMDKVASELPDSAYGTMAWDTEFDPPGYSPQHYGTYGTSVYDFIEEQPDGSQRPKRRSEGVRTARNPVEQMGGLENWLSFLIANGVGEDTIDRIKSGELPYDNRSRMTRARSMNLDTATPFRRVDVPGRTTFLANPSNPGTPGRTRKLVYAAPTYEQAELGNQTAGRSKYPLLFPEGILGLHPDAIAPDKAEPSVLSRLLSESLRSKRAAPWDGDEWPVGTPLRRFASELTTEQFNALFHTLNELTLADRMRRNAMRELDADIPYSDIPTMFDAPGGRASTRKAMRDSFLRSNQTFREAMKLGEPVPQHSVVDMHFDNLTGGLSQNLESYHGWGPGQMLHFQAMDFGLADVLKDLGVTGSVVADETGMSVATFHPEAIRHRTLSALDPLAKGRPNIFQSLLAPVAAGAAAAASQTQENR